MSSMPIIDENGQIKVEAGTLQVIQSEHPVYKARNAIALPQGSWLYAPESGHDLDQYKQKKGSLSNAEEFQKSALLYLKPYGAEVAGRLIKRGEASFNIEISREAENA